jgi:hypothetical protein
MRHISGPDHGKREEGREEKKKKEDLGVGGMSKRADRRVYYRFRLHSLHLKKLD